MRMTIPKSYYHEILKNIHCPENKIYLDKIYGLVQPHREDIAAYFHNAMMSNEGTAEFINIVIVNERLHETLSGWLPSPFIYQTDDDLIRSYIDAQIEIGIVHERIDLPMHFMNYGMSLIKRQILKLLQEANLEREEQAATMIVAIQCLDFVKDLINESYQGNMLRNKKREQAFKLQFASKNLALDCEKMRSELSDWMRELLLFIQQENFDVVNIVSIKNSNFGLWFAHKAHFLLDSHKYALLSKSFRVLDHCFNEFTEKILDVHLRKERLAALNQAISKSMWLLDDISQSIVNQDDGKDPLTQLFNRRYLHTVLHYETDCSIKSGLLFGLIMVDIDFFKKINDTYGHSVGDKVLSQVAGVVSREMRAGDFVFRYGGEEFLIVITDINMSVLRRTAEKIRSAIEMTSFTVDKNAHLNITISIGAALHDGHPDFMRTINAADGALFKAKNNGRNCVIVVE